MTCKLGDRTFKKNEQDIESFMAREDAQVSKIRELIKERNKERGERHRIHQRAPASKRRKLENETYETRQEQPNMEEGKAQEKRKADKNSEHGAEPSEKRMRLTDIRTLFKSQLDRTETAPQVGAQEQQEQTQDTPAQDQPAQDQPGTYYGEEETVELINWEEIFHKHLEETRRLDRKKDKN